LNVKNKQDKEPYKCNILFYNIEVINKFLEWLYRKRN